MTTAATATPCITNARLTTIYSGYHFVNLQVAARLDGKDVSASGRVRRSDEKLTQALAEHDVEAALELIGSSEEKARGCDRSIALLHPHRDHIRLALLEEREAAEHRAWTLTRNTIANLRARLD